MQYISPVVNRDQLFANHVETLEGAVSRLIGSENELILRLRKCHSPQELRIIYALLKVESSLVIEQLIKETYENFLYEVPEDILRSVILPLEF